MTATKSARIELVVASDWLYACLEKSDKKTQLSFQKGKKVYIDSKY